MDMFKPKYKHSDAKVRLGAIEKLKDEHLLVKIATHDKAQEVRLAAVEKVEDPKHLSVIARTG